MFKYFHFSDMSAVIDLIDGVTCEPAKEPWM